MADLLGPDEAARPADLARRVALVPASSLAVPSTMVPMAGRWRTDGDALRFTPRFVLAPGTEYVLVRTDTWSTGGVGWVEVARLRRPARRTPPTTRVVEIHPTAAEVPENLLRLSVTFSAPMDEGSATGHLHLRNRAGDDVAHAVLAMPPELWDRPRRRLTLLLEPGRIKRGLVPNTELGPPLVEAEEVSLVVDAAMRDAVGAGLVAGARRRYRVGPAVRSRVDPERWGVRWPAAGSTDPLSVDFDRPLDHALVRTCLRVTDAAGFSLPGRRSLGPGELRWSFVPTQPWSAGAYEVHVDAALEDLAGNSVRRVFDRDLRLPQDDPLDLAEVVLRPTPPPADEVGSPAGPWQQEALTRTRLRPAQTAGSA